MLAAQFWGYSAIGGDICKNVKAIDSLKMAAVIRIFAIGWLAKFGSPTCIFGGRRS